MIGRTISHYRVVEKLGEGGMGVIYVAEDTLLGRRVALKTLSAVRNREGPSFRSRFLREARAVSALSHPHIATIYDYGETEDGQQYIVMELVKGKTLADLMLTETPTISRAIEIIKQVAEALAEAHRHGIIHRDIKPSNVALDERDSVKVLDFGLAKQLDPGQLNPADLEHQTLLNTSTREGVIVGTPMYLSPEQALGVAVDARSDLFSLGALLYECLAGKPPFSGRSSAEICAKVLRDDPPPPSHFNASVPRELDRIALKALAKQPESRYQTAAELITDLEAVRAEVQGFDQVITRTLRATPGTHPTRALATLSDLFKRPRLSVGYVVAGLVVVGLLALAAWRVTRAKPHQPAPQAQRLYDRAVDAMHEGAFFRASKILQQAVQDDDHFALAHARLAEAWTELDFSDKAKDELIHATDLVPDRSILPRLEGLRLQATTDIVKRDFAKAVEDYQAIVSLAPNAEKAYALVDLGRAYEKAEQPDKAIDSYQQATQLDPRSAAAFLRLGVVEGRRQRFDEAFAAFDQAYKLFDVSSEIEGMTEVLLQRGVLLGQQGKVNEARAQLLQALEKSAALENKDKRVKVLLNLSEVALHAGDTAQAEQYSTQALELAQANHMENLTTSGLINIGNAYFVKGNFTEAEKKFSDALSLAQLNKGRRNEARALLSLSSLRSQQGDTDAARDFFQRALPFYELGGYRKEVFQAYVILGRAEDNSGEYGAAQQRFEQLLQQAQQGGDPQSTALAQEGLGSVLLNTQRFPEALAHFDETYKIDKSLNAKLSVGYAEESRAEVLWELGRYGEARAALAEALTIAENAGHEPFQELLASVHETSARLALSQRNLQEATAEAQKALALAGSEYKSIAVAAGCALGLAESLAGQAAAGRKHCEGAVDLGRKIRNPIPLSRALLALAECALIGGDAQTALTSASEAQKRFAAAKQYESEWRAWLIEARVSAKTGDRTRARELATQAGVVLGNLQGEWSSDSFKSYSDRPDVQELQVQFKKLVGSQITG